MSNRTKDILVVLGFTLVVISVIGMAVLMPEQNDKIIRIWACDGDLGYFVITTVGEQIEDPGNPDHQKFASYDAALGGNGHVWFHKDMVCNVYKPKRVGRP